MDDNLRERFYFPPLPNELWVAEWITWYLEDLYRGKSISRKKLRSLVKDWLDAGNDDYSPARKLAERFTEYYKENFEVEEEVE